MAQSTVLAAGNRDNAGGIISALNGPWHRPALYLFMAFLVAHLAEHMLQAVQIFLLHWPRPLARGALGVVWPWLVTSEWLHYVYAIGTLAGLLVLRPAFTGRSRTWWNIALWIQVWHHFEHVLLLGQVLTGQYLFGAKVPTSILQLVVPRVELHLFYNAAVSIPMIVAVIYHMFPAPGEAPAQCDCSLRGVRHRTHQPA